VDIKEKKKHIKKINSRRKYSNKPRPNKDIWKWKKQHYKKWKLKKNYCWQN
jgi:hypothetical protein